MKKWFILGILAIVAFAYFNHFVLKPWGIGCGQNEEPPEIIVDTWSKPLKEAGYTPAMPHKPGNIPKPKHPPSGEPILHGTGTVENSGETVEIIGVQTPDGQKWIRGWVGDREITFQHLDWWEEPPRHNDDSDLSLIACCAWVDDSADFGVGVAWQPFHVGWADLGLAGTFDINQDITTSPDWAALSGCLSRSMGPVNIGAGAGYRFGQDAGLHLELNAGLEIAL